MVSRKGHPSLFKERLNPLGGDTKGWPPSVAGKVTLLTKLHPLDDVMEATSNPWGPHLWGSPSASSESQKLGQGWPWRSRRESQGTNLKAARAVGVVQEQALCCQTHLQNSPG